MLATRVGANRIRDFFVICCRNFKVKDLLENGLAPVEVATEVSAGLCPK